MRVFWKQYQKGLPETEKLIRSVLNSWKHICPLKLYVNDVLSYILMQPEGWGGGEGGTH